MPHTTNNILQVDGVSSTGDDVKWSGEMAPDVSGTKWHRNGRRNIGLVPSMSMLSIRSYDDESNDDLKQHRIEAMWEQRARDGARRTAGALGRAALRSGMPIVLQICTVEGVVPSIVRRQNGNEIMHRTRNNANTQ